jgi:ring-1,2-phenylacetyl-CoA epoxidase subunit PaaD
MVKDSAVNTAPLTIDQIWTWLGEVADPEIPIISIVDLGIVRNVSWEEDQNGPGLVVTVTPTYSGCPATAVIKQDILSALRQHGIARVRIETRLSPAWTTDWLSQEGRQRLREYGTVPPIRRCSEDDPSEKIRPASANDKEAAGNPELGIECPRCGSTDTRTISWFGSTPCKALYVCNACGEPFDYFKCH